MTAKPGAVNGIFLRNDDGPATLPFAILTQVEKRELARGPEICAGGKGMTAALNIFLVFTDKLF